MRETPATSPGSSTKGVAPWYRRRKSVRYGATASAASSQAPSPTAALSSPKVLRSGGRGMDGGRAAEMASLEAFDASFPHRRRHGLQIPNQAAERHQLQHVERDVEFPPVKALAHGRGIVMVIVVPALAQRDDGQPHVIAAGIA